MKYCQDYPYYDLQDNFSGNFYIIKSIHELICKDDDSGKEAYIDDDTPIFSDEWLAWIWTHWKGSYLKNELIKISRTLWIWDL